MSNQNASDDLTDIQAETALDADFIEQAEYISEADFAALSAEHPDEESIVRKLSMGGAKLLVGPRGCGKTTLMLKAFYSTLRDPGSTSLPIYVNFKLSLKLEPLYVNTPSAGYWFNQWLVLKVYEGLWKTFTESLGRLSAPTSFHHLNEVKKLISFVELGRISSNSSELNLTTEGLVADIAEIIKQNDLARCVLLMDDAAHAFSPRQQEDFFEFFRQIKSKDIFPKAAIYPGITTHSPNFHVGHDAEQIDAWVRPDRPEYLVFMRALAERRFRGNVPEPFTQNPEYIDFLAYSSFGIPRSFLNMLRSLNDRSGNSNGAGQGIDRRNVLDAAKQGREAAHNVFESLAFKLPAYKEFIESGRGIYQNIISSLKSYNKLKPDNNQALEIGIKKPIDPAIEKVISFFQYAGLLLPVGENSRGIKGVFELYMVHFGDLVTENAIIGRRAKSLDSFITAFTAQTHQAWPRVSPETLLRAGGEILPLRLTLPNCQQCDTPRMNEHSRFCHNCGSPLKNSSLYEELTNQDISMLPISRRLVVRIKKESNIRKVKDILIDSDRTNLRGVSYIGPVRAERIASYAEEHVA